MATPFTERIQASRSQQAAVQKQQAEFKSMITEMRKTQAASLVGSSKPSVILTDQTDLGDKVKELTTKTVAAIEGLDTTEHHKDQLQAIQALRSDIQSLEEAVDEWQTALERQTVQIVGAIRGLKLNPQITVPTPEVVINEKAINWKPLEKAINGLKVEKQLSLSDYRAHDLDTAPDGTQYIGYIAIDGSWYIIQSNDETNTMRYYFGKGDYSEGWEYRVGHNYTTLSEAIRALSA